MRLAMLSMATAVCLSSSAIGQNRNSSPSVTDIHAENCMVRAINHVDVSARAEGVLTKLIVEEGDAIEKGGSVAIIDDTIAKLTLAHKRAEEKEAVLNAENEVNIKDAVNSEKLATAEAKAYQDLHRDRAIPFWEMEKKRLEAERAKLRITLAEMNKMIAEAQREAKTQEVKLAEYELTRRTVSAPYTGFIEKRKAQLGQWVQPGTPIATIIQMDKLRIEGDIDGLRYPGQIIKGTPVLIKIYTQGDRTEGERAKAIKREGKLGYVSMEVNLNKQYRVWVEIENERVGDDWLIKPGMNASIIIQKTAPLF